MKQYTPYIRMTLKVLAGILLGDGLADDELVEQLVGGMMAGLSVAWYLAEKRGWV